jgi:hypothetical protein
MLKSEN